MIDTEHVKCDTCTAPEPMELDASDEASRGWPTVDIETNPYKAQFPLFQQHPEIAFLSKEKNLRLPPPLSAPPACSTPSATSTSA